VRADPDRGFSLLEMLVALALLGLLVGLLHEGLTLGHRVWERAGARLAARIEAVEGAQLVLRDRLAGLNPAWLNEGDSSRVLLEGAPTSMTFFARGADAEASGTFRRLSVAATVEGRLELAWHPDTDRSPLPDWTRAPLLGGIAGAEFAYFGPTRTDPTPRWRDRWQGQEFPPRLVRLRIQFPAGDPRIWPELVVAPRATIDAGCTFDPQRRRCAGRS